MTDVLENETNPVTFSCQATGEPVPTITWYFDGVMINVSNKSKYNVTSLINDTMVTNIITIVNARLSDAGIYNCCAENSIDIDCSAGVLTVNGMFGVLTFVYIYTADIYAYHANFRYLKIYM